MIAKFKQPNYNTQNGSEYPLAIDASVSVLGQLAAQFAVAAQDTPDLTVHMEGGRLLVDGAIVFVDPQNSAALTAPVSNPRNDIVYIDAETGVLGIAQGTESLTPADPALPANKIPAARIRWSVGATAITNSMIDDLRCTSPGGGGGGLTYFTESRDTTAPNDTVPVHALTATGMETDIDVALVPKGVGSIIAQIPDGAWTGGNKRGAYAVDLQMSRSNASEVASSEVSVIVGGSNNTASGFGSIVVGGLANKATESYACILGGADNEASGYCSHIPGGNGATTRGLWGRQSYASNYYTVIGDSQVGSHPLSTRTTDATAKILTSDGATPLSDNVPVLPDDHSYAITATIVARDTSTGDTKVWKIEGAAKRGLFPDTVALIGTPTKTVIGADAGATSWDCDLVVNTTRGSAEIQVTGEALKTIRWMCRFDSVEVR